MISYRNSQRLLVCDWCFRPKRTGEEGWAHGVKVKRRHRTADEIALGGEGSLVDHVEDRCPGCLPTESPVDA